MEQLTCLKCGSEEYYTELKSNNNVARCSRCDSFIKNIPYGNPTMYIGKYKNVAVSDIDDIVYLRWALQNMTTIGKTIRDAIIKQIDKLENESR